METCIDKIILLLAKISQHIIPELLVHKYILKYTHLSLINIELQEHGGNNKLFTV